MLTLNLNFVCHLVEMHCENCGEYEYEYNKSNAYANYNKYFIKKGTLHMFEMDHITFLLNFGEHEFTVFCCSVN